ncbi:hypothetical protein CAPTEDRAFT_213763 [Capitella teleta]|uniref:Uncharacterized protein n=1 Tax=Capitella teleta TaxID=283909 RepID=R7UG13_CAPTE|nr:hypothetical protein CAPTEDRAFT_213763 [Capitella teleta]|eukprot:ELU02227.1 hypothetical protein CAPTEDRAFT_213763 [Capitella teleta]
MADESGVANVQESKPVTMDTEPPVAKDTVETTEQPPNGDADSKVDNSADEGCEKSGDVEEPVAAADDDDDEEGQSPETKGDEEKEVNGQEEGPSTDQKSVESEEQEESVEKKTETAKEEEEAVAKEEGEESKVTEEEKKVEEKDEEEVAEKKPEEAAAEEKEAPKTIEKVEDVKVEETEKEEETGPFNGIFLHTESENLEPFLVAVGRAYNKGILAILLLEALKSKTHVTISSRIEDGKLIQYYEPQEGSKIQPLQITREIDGDILIQTMEVGNVKCTRKFKRKT